MVLKTAILSEKYATDYNWYVDVVLQLIRIAGDYVSDEVWHRVVQVFRFSKVSKSKFSRSSQIERTSKATLPKLYLKHSKRQHVTRIWSR